MLVGVIESCIVVCIVKLEERIGNNVVLCVCVKYNHCTWKLEYYLKKIVGSYYQ